MSKKKSEPSPLQQGKNIGFRATQDEVEKMYYICQIHGTTPTEFLRGCVNAEYDRLSDNQQLKSLIEQMRELRDAFDSLSGTNHSEP